MSYVEPTTGAVWATSEGPYLSVEALFNDKNYWVNMQQQRRRRRQNQQCQSRHQDDEHKPVDPGQQKVETSSSLSFDLLDGNLWTYVFMDPIQEASTTDLGRPLCPSLLLLSPCLESEEYRVPPVFLRYPYTSLIVLPRDHVFWVGRRRWSRQVKTTTLVFSPRMV